MDKNFPHLDLKQTQSQQLMMTPQLQQAIQLLQMNNLDLSAFIEGELEKNPLLEKDEGPAEEGMDLDIDAREDVRDTAAQDDDGMAQNYDETWDKDAAADQDHSGPSSHISGSGGSSSFDFSDYNFEDHMSSDKSLREHLTEQLMIACSEPRDRVIGGLLIDHLSESGYLRTAPDDLAQQLGCSLDRIERLLTVMKGFDPTGIFAQDLQECLALQLDEKGALDGPMRALLDNLALLGAHDYTKLCAVCGVNETYLHDMIAELRMLNPKPATLFDHVVAQTAVPDVFMRRRPKNVGGGWRVELNSDTLPRVLVNQEYYTVVSEGAVRKEDKAYLSSQMSAASWLVRALDQRAQTILKTAAAIIEEQEAFFNYGIEFLRPLTLKDIAETIEMHESTVSRVTSGKYIGTPRGIYELKFFFSTALVSESGAAHSSESIKARIKTLIHDEDPKKILSDDKIVALLKDEGIDLARRTVAKYREGMNIGSSVERRRQKKNLIV